MKYSVKELMSINYAKLFYGRYRNNFFARIYYKNKSKKSLRRLMNKSTMIPIICDKTNEVGQLTHPDGFVTGEKFDNKVILTVSGYPFGSEHDESQYILVSSDGIHFQNIVDNMALAEYTGNGRSHFSDGEIIEDNGKIYLFYRFCDVDHGDRIITILRKETDNLKEWNNESIILKKTAQTYISPAIVKVYNGYNMFFVEEQNDENMVLKRIHIDNIDFDNPIEEKVEIENIPPNMKLWHVDVIEEEDILHGLFVYTIGSGGKGARLFYAQSRDGGKKWKTYEEIKLDVNYEYVSKVYSSTMIKVNGEWFLYVPVNTKDECWFLLLKQGFNPESYMI